MMSRMKALYTTKENPQLSSSAREMQTDLEERTSATKNRLVAFERTTISVLLDKVVVATTKSECHLIAAATVAGSAGPRRAT